jgi:hypothetical protein
MPKNSMTVEQDFLSNVLTEKSSRYTPTIKLQSLYNYYNENVSVLNGMNESFIINYSINQSIILITEFIISLVFFHHDFHEICFETDGRIMSKHAVLSFSLAEIGAVTFVILLHHAGLLE